MNIQEVISIKVREIFAYDHNRYSLIFIFHSAAFVEFEKVEVECPERPGGSIVLDLSKLDGNITDCGPQEYTLKEGSKTRLKISFKVHNNVVLGLKVCSSVKTKIKLFKDEEVLGTFAPDSNLV